MEQQVSIIADYFFLKKQDYAAWLRAIGPTINFRGISDKNIAGKYEYTLSQFLKQR
ncbi:hypothetical protein [Chania multitudinisentens]|uniref:hypothetical protein n=1 Tax=Chania multitudinisentens TaxID=1639108 RepID=UPI0003E13F0E|nr:hypothetical protein [Chania multitudinisentens]